MSLSEFCFVFSHFDLPENYFFCITQYYSLCCVMFQAVPYLSCTACRTGVVNLLLVCYVFFSDHFQFFYIGA
jgi:hypothetical protein